MCGLQRSYPHSFSAVRALNVAESHHSMFGVRVAEKFVDFSEPANWKKDDPLRAHGGRIVTLAETQQSAHGV